MEDILKTVSSSYAKGKAYFLNQIKTGKIPHCSVGYVSGSCKSGHKYAAVQFCGKEYCMDCGRDGSPIHQRRVNKWYNYAKSWTGVGYLVITVPENIRQFFYNKLVLADFRKKCLRLLKERYGIKKGLARYHYFGDCKVCSAKGCIYCQNTGSGKDYYPHLNILFEAGYIENLENYLKPLKQWILQYFKKLVKNHLTQLQDKLDLRSDNQIKQIDEYLEILSTLNKKGYSLVVNYSYVVDEKMVMNRIKYITRSTFRQFKKKTVKTLYNFRNSVVWGWTKSDKIDDEEKQIIACPECAKKNIQLPIHWHRLQKYNDNQQIKTYEKQGKKPVFSIRNGSNEANRRCRKWIPITVRKAKGKIPSLPAINSSNQCAALRSESIN